MKKTNFHDEEKSKKVTPVRGTQTVDLLHCDTQIRYAANETEFMHININAKTPFENIKKYVFVFFLFFCNKMKTIS